VDDIPEAIARRRAVAVAGHTGDVATARAALDDPEPGVRATALGALARLASLTPDDARRALADPDPSVRRRAATEARAFAHGEVDLVPVLTEPDPLVAEAAAWALGERGDGTGGPADVVDALADTATGHEDALVREAAVAALGAIGDERGLPAILRATTDKPAVRRRAVLALAPFEGPEVDEALARAATDRDWQVRQAAEDLTGPA
jgi:HEAT repeat protein